MKNILKNLKYITFALVFIITGFVFSHSASADQYTYFCSDYGTIISDVSISPAGPFTAGNPTSFTASGQLTSTCGTRTVNLTAQNNTGTVITLIPDTSISAGPPFPQPAAFTTFSSPTTASPSYAVHFITGVDEPIQNPENVLFANNSLGARIDNITFDGVSVNPFPDYNGSREFYESLDPSVDVYIEWTNEFNGFPGETVVVTDSYGATQCKMIEKGDPNPYWTFSGVDTTGPGSYIITVEASNNPNCP